MNDALRAAASVDPDWAKKEQRRQWLVKATVAGTLLALAVGAVAFVIAHHDSERITRVEQSACQVNAGSYECQHTKFQAEKKANLRTTCEPFFKAGYPCPKPGSTAAERQSKRQAQAGSGSAADLNSGSSAGGTPAAGGSPEAAAPPKGGSGGAPAPHHPGSTQPTGPEAGPAEGPTPAPNDSSGEQSHPEETAATDTGSESATASPAQGLIPSTVEAARGVVEHVEAEVLAPTLCTVRGLLKACP